MNMAKSIIHLEDIEPKVFGMYENCYVELEENIKKELFDKAIELSPRKSLSSLSKILDEKLYLLSDARNRTPIRLSLLKKLSDLLVNNGFHQFSLLNLEKYVEYIKGMGHGTKIIRPKFPFNFATPQGVRIISKLYHDGGISKSRETHYHNQNLELINEFCNDIKNVFGDIIIKIQNKTKRTRKYTVELPRLIGDVLEKIGCFLGSKVENEVSPPEWLLDLDKDILCEYLRSAFDDEGSVSTRGVTLGLASEINNKISEEVRNTLLHLSEKDKTKFLRELFKQDEKLQEKCTSKILVFNKELLTKVGIKVFGPYLGRCYADKKNEKIRIICYILMTGKSNLEKFNKIIGFKLKHKKEKLSLYLNQTRNVAPQRGATMNFIRMAFGVQKENGYCTDFLIAKKFNYHHQYLGRVRMQAEKVGLIKRVGRDWHKIKYVVADKL
jgi:hypothetical protein